MKLYALIFLLIATFAACNNNNGQTAPDQARRIATYQSISPKLALMSNADIEALLTPNTAISTGICGGSAGGITIDGTAVFYKKINLSDLEQQPENVMSTRNMFELPLYYQYGIGSMGFGVWRELSAHIITTNWVLTGACPNFPLMYHWRILPKQSEVITPEILKQCDEYVEYWGGSDVVRQRALALHQASAQIVLFLEYIPHVLGPWLEEQLATNDTIAQLAAAMVERECRHVTSFMRDHGMLHFDAHFANILTDGKRLYFGDFGLAISEQFDLSADERNFFATHRNYDLCSTMGNLTGYVIESFCQKDDADGILREYAVGNGRHIKAPWGHDIVSRYAPIAATLEDFYAKLRKDKSTLFLPLSLDDIEHHTL